MVDHAGPGRDRDQDEGAEELDDEPDPQWPLPEGVLLEPDQVVAPEQSIVLGVRIAGYVRHVPFSTFLAV